MMLRFFLSISLMLTYASLFGQNTILWKISNANSKKNSYLLGSYHLLGNSFIDSYPVIKEKLLTTDLVITETKINRTEIAAYYNTRNSIDTLSTILPKADLDFIAGIFKHRQIDITKFTPGELYIKLQSNYPKYTCDAFSKTDTLIMDEYIQLLGALNHKRLQYLETDLFQIELLKQRSKIYDWAFFKNNIASVLAMYRSDRSKKQTCSFVNQYTSLKFNYRFEEVCHYIKDSGINNIYLTTRNEDWIQKLPAYLEKNNCFITVGLAHLYNTCGLIELLRKQGYHVEPVKMK